MANINGNAGNNILIGTNQNDLINGQAGNDLIQGLAGNDIIDGSSGIDTADYRRYPGITVTLNGSTDALLMVGGVHEDTLRRVEKIFGGSGDDFITGDVLENTFRGGLGADILDGAAGVDTADYSDKTQSVVVTLNAASDSIVAVGGSDEDTLRNIENVIGGSAGRYSDRRWPEQFLPGRGRRRYHRRRKRQRYRRFSGKGDFRCRFSQRRRGRHCIRRRRYRGHASQRRKFARRVGERHFIGDALANKLSGARGNDWLRGGWGPTFSMVAKTSILPIMATRTFRVRHAERQQSNVTIGGVAEDTILKIENVVGGSGDDFLTGDVLANTFRGGLGADILDGGRVSTPPTIATSLSPSS